MLDLLALAPQVLQNIGAYILGVECQARRLSKALRATLENVRTFQKALTLCIFVAHLWIVVAVLLQREPTGSEA